MLGSAIGVKYAHQAFHNPLHGPVTRWHFPCRDIWFKSCEARQETQQGSLALQETERSTPEPRKIGTLLCALTPRKFHFHFMAATAHSISFSQSRSHLSPHYILLMFWYAELQTSLRDIAPIFTISYFTMVILVQLQDSLITLQENHHQHQAMCSLHEG